MRKTRIPIATRFVLAYLVASVLLSVLIVRHLVNDHATQLTHEVAKKGEAVTRLFARSLVSPLYQLDVDAMENSIGHVQGLEDVREVLVFNECGQAVTDGTVENPRVGDPVPGVDEVMRSREKRPHCAAEESRLRFTLSVLLGDRVLGGVRLDLSLENAQSKVFRLLRELLLLAAALVLLGALPVWLVTHFFLRPLVFGDA